MQVPFSRFIFRTLLVFAIVSFLSSSALKALPAHTQRLHYRVYVSGKDRGSLHADITRQQDASFQIRLETRLHFPFTDVVSLIQVNYSSKGLEQASSMKHINNDLKEKFITQRVNGGYSLTDVDGNNSQFKQEIPFSVGRLYHDEPVGRSEIFSERLGAFVPLRTLRKGEYELVQPDGKKNVFVYRYGICTEMRTEMMACNVRFVLSE